MSVLRYRFLKRLVGGEGFAPTHPKGADLQSAAALSLCRPPSPFAVGLLMRKPRSGFFYSEAVEDIVHLPDLTVWDSPRMQPIGFTARHAAEPKPARKVTKKKPVKRALRGSGR
jgi:hypothetical protein